VIEAAAIEPEQASVPAQTAPEPAREPEPAVTVIAEPAPAPVELTVSVEQPAVVAHDAPADAATGIASPVAEAPAPEPTHTSTGASAIPVQTSQAEQQLKVTPNETVPAPRGSVTGPVTIRTSGTEDDTELSLESILAEHESDAEVELANKLTIKPTDVPASPVGMRSPSPARSRLPSDGDGAESVATLTARGPALGEAKPAECVVGDKLWVSHDAFSYVPGTVYRVTDTAVEVRLEPEPGMEVNETTASIPFVPPTGNKKRRWALPRSDDTSNRAGVENMDDLTQLNEASILSNIRNRFVEDLIYTATGPILIAVNPYKWLDIYNDKVMRQYASGAPCPPHCFSVAQDALVSVRESRMTTSASIIICGESGSGKTETTKLMLKYISKVSSRSESDEIATRIMESNPIMEAFGNAQTLRNHNSSRFGKFVRVFFDSHCTVTGGTITNYLLEKSRCVSRGRGERNYHIFYQLCAGADAILKQKLHLSDAKHFAFLGGEDVSPAVGIDDVADFRATVSAFAKMGFSHQERDTFFRIVSGLLHFGNVQFHEHGVGSKIAAASEGSLKVATDLWQLSAATLTNALCNRSITTTEGAISTPMTPAQATSARDALAKAVYGRLFERLIVIINQRLAVDQGNVSADSAAAKSSAEDVLAFIGILDIYGFENMTCNGFEQIFINYANEKLQNLFNQQIFRAEAIEYDAEGIVWNPTDFPDNTPCVEMLEKRPIGLFSFLQEECLLGPRGSEQSLLSKIFKNNVKSSIIMPAGPTTSFKRGGSDFIIVHYAGPIVYTCEEFLEKNRDTLYESLAEVMRESKCTLIEEMFQAESSGGVTKGKTGKGTAMQQTVSQRFSEEMGMLIKTVQQTSPRFVRCIKPNTTASERIIDSPLVLAQLNYAGVMAALNMRKIGWPTRLRHAQFLNRYATFLPFSMRSSISATASLDAGKPIATKATSPKPLTNEQVKTHLMKLFAHTNLKDLVSERFQIGATKVFLRANVLSSLDSAASRRLNGAATVIAAAYKSVLTQRKFRKFVRALLDVQAYVRGRLQRKRFAKQLAGYRKRVAMDKLKRRVAAADALFQATETLIASNPTIGLLDHVSVQSARPKAIEARLPVDAMSAESDITTATTKVELYYAAVETFRRAVQSNIDALKSQKEARDQALNTLTTCAGYMKLAVQAACESLLVNVNDLLTSVDATVIISDVEACKVSKALTDSLMATCDVYKTNYCRNQSSRILQLLHAGSGAFHAACSAVTSNYSTLQAACETALSRSHAARNACNVERNRRQLIESKAKQAHLQLEAAGAQLQQLATQAQDAGVSDWSDVRRTLHQAHQCIDTTRLDIGKAQQTSLADESALEPFQTVAASTDLEYLVTVAEHTCQTQLNAAFAAVVSAATQSLTNVSDAISACVDQYKMEAEYLAGAHANLKSFSQQFLAMLELASSFLGIEVPPRVVESLTAGWAAAAVQVVFARIPRGNLRDVLERAYTLINSAATGIERLEQKRGLSGRSATLDLDAATGSLEDCSLCIKQSMPKLTGEIEVRGHIMLFACTISWCRS
jgi:myosin heavy subunit